MLNLVVFYLESRGYNSFIYIYFSPKAKQEQCQCWALLILSSLLLHFEEPSITPQPQLPKEVAPQKNRNPLSGGRKFYFYVEFRIKIRRKDTHRTCGLKLNPCLLPCFSPYGEISDVCQEGAHGAWRGLPCSSLLCGLIKAPWISAMAMLYTSGKEDVFFLILITWFPPYEQPEPRASLPSISVTRCSNISLVTRIYGCIFRVYLVQVPTTDSFSSAAGRPAYQGEVWVLSTFLPSSAWPIAMMWALSHN